MFAAVIEFTVEVLLDAGLRRRANSDFVLYAVPTSLSNRANAKDHNFTSQISLNSYKQNVLYKEIIIYGNEEYVIFTTLI